MPIGLELMVLMLVAYLAGLTLGWGLWGRSHINPNAQTKDET